MIEKINVILVMYNCCICKSIAMHTTVSSHVLKRFYKIHFKSVRCRDYEDDFNVFSLQAQVRLQPEVTKGSNLASLYN